MEQMKEKKIILPFLKWAGGKRWLVTTYSSLFPTTFGRYIEPFLGSGSVYFHLAPARALLADTNRDLIDTYRAIKCNWGKISKLIRTHHNNHTHQYYYKVRASLPRTIYGRAARFIYLNRTCWNGLYRVNLNGEFNVPVGTKKNVILSTDDFESVANILKGADLYDDDFEKIIGRARNGDFVFVDPPYTVKHNYNGFVKYNENLFSWDDQKRLRNAIIRAKSRGALVMITNANHRSIHELYKGVGKFRVLTRPSILAANANFRGESQELIITCW